MSSKDFENGAKYNEERDRQANSAKREHFEQAMRFHQVTWDRRENGDNNLSGGRKSWSNKGHATEGGE